MDLQEKSLEQEIIELRKKNQKLKRQKVLYTVFSGIFLAIMIYDYIIVKLF